LLPLLQTEIEPQLGQAPAPALGKLLINAINTAEPDEFNVVRSPARPKKVSAVRLAELVDKEAKLALDLDRVRKERKRVEAALAKQDAKHDAAKAKVARGGTSAV